ncbi:MAG: hypothetical protein FWF69_07565 [Firmicutes bacterium]|nr:hypothetical protein [Bacillota bacterium]
MVVAFLGAYICVFITLLGVIGKTTEGTFDVPGANDIVKTISEKWDDVAGGGSPGIVSLLPYAVFDSGGGAVYATQDDLVKNLNGRYSSSLYPDRCHKRQCNHRESRFL